MRPDTVRKVPAIAVWPGLAITLLGSAASAQSDAQILTELRECSRIQIDRARLNCFDGVFANDGLAAPGTESDGGTRGAVSAAASSAVAATEAQREPELDRRSPASRDAGQLPAEHVVTVVEVTELGRGNFRFVTSDGRVYTQPVGSPPRRNYPSVPFQAELYAGAFSSLFIRPLEGGPQTRVVAED